MAKTKPKQPAISDEWHTDEPMAYAVKCHDQVIAEYRIFADESEARRFAERQIEAAEEDDEDSADHMIGKVYPLYAGNGRCLHEERFS